MRFHPGPPPLLLFDSDQAVLEVLSIKEVMSAVVWGLKLSVHRIPSKQTSLHCLHSHIKDSRIISILIRSSLEHVDRLRNEPFSLSSHSKDFLPRSLLLVAHLHFRGRRRQVASHYFFHLAIYLIKASADRYHLETLDSTTP